MDIINNRYRVIKFIKQNKVSSTYLVHDLNTRQKIMLNIIKHERVPSALIDYYAQEFITWTNIESFRTNRVYEFGIINLIDNKKLNEIKYYYTNEYYNCNKSFNKIAKDIDTEEKILDVFINICEAINYLHLKGFVYNELDINNLCIGKENIQELKLKDIPTVQLERFSLNGKGNIWNKDIELNEKNNKNEFVDIYCLGIMLIYLCNKEWDCNIKFQDYIVCMEDLKFKEKLSEEFLSNACDIIKNCTCKDVKRSYANVNQIVKDVNVRFAKIYSLQKTEEVKKINFNLKLIGRNEEVKSVMEDYKSIIENSSKDRIALVQGETGIGKTKFLKSIKNLLTYNKANVYSSFSLNKQVDQPFKEILKQIVAECEPNILQKYEEDLSKFIPELQFTPNILHTDLMDVTKERLKLLNRIYGFINEFTKYKSIVIIIDDIHLADEFSIELLDYICSTEVKNKNIYLILSYCDGKHVLNKSTLRFIESIKCRSNVSNIHLKGLDEEQTGIMIKYILSMQQVPKIFSKKIYSKSYGNPLFIEEVIKSFFGKGIIYINEEDGKWETDYKYDDFPIPSDINEILINQIKDIDILSYEILSAICIFLTPVSIQTINFMNSNSGVKIDDSIDLMLDKSLLCKKIGDEGFVFDFYNKLLKDLIYDRIDEKERKVKHKLAAEFLEKQYNFGHEEHIEELIYHLQKAGQSDKVINYCLKNAKKMKKFNNNIEAIKNIKKAIEVIEKTNVNEKKLDLMMEIGDLYKQTGDFTEALAYFSNIQNMSRNMGQTKVQIDSLNKMGKIYYDKNNITKVKECINKVSKVINKEEYLQGYLDYKVLFVKVCNVEKMYEEAYNICLEGIDLCTEEYKIYKGVFYNLIGYIFILTGKIERAEKSLQNAIEIFTETNYYDGMVVALNNMGVIYGDYYQDFDKAIDVYNKILEICNKNNLIVNEIIAITNIAEVYFHNQDYYSALKKFEDVENKSRKYDFEGSLFYAYIFLCKIYLRISNYQKLYEYYELATKELERYPLHGSDICEYYSVYGELSLEFGDLDKAYTCTKKALELYEIDESLLKLNSEFLLNYMKLFNSDKEKCLRLLEEIKGTIDKINNFGTKVYLMYKLGVFLYSNNLYDEGKDILQEIKVITAQENQLYYTEIRVMYLEALYDDKDKVKSLNNVLELVKKEENKKLESEIYNHIGEYYFGKENYFEAFVYYFECCEVLIELIKQLPQEYRKYFVEFYNVKGIIDKLKAIKSYYHGNMEGIKENIKEEYDINVEDITSILNFINCKDIMDNRCFMKSVKNFYSSIFHNEIHDIRDVLNNLNSDDKGNLKVILQYMLYSTMGTEAYILDEENSGYTVIVSSDESKPLNKGDLEIINQCKLKKDTILISNTDVYQMLEEKKVNLKNIKACICMPIISISNMKNNAGMDSRRNNLYDETTIAAYVYVRSKRALNNFDSKSLKKCIQLNGLIRLIIQKYKLNKIAAYDKLTETLTRKYLEEEIEKSLEVAGENNGVFSMIMFDLDRFKNINDKFGHQTGDEVLKKVCNIVKSNIRNSDICGRYGGEEFIIILRNTRVEDAKNVAEKVREKIEEANILGDKAKVTVSMGIVSYPKHGQWKQQLIEKVDQSLYVAKKRGRNQCRVWDEGTSNKIKCTNKLMGIITENEVQNNRNVLVMVELIELINKRMDFKEKIYKILGRIIEITESQYGTLIQIEDGNIQEIFSRKTFEERWVNNLNCNKEIVRCVIEKRRGVYMIDWDNIIEKDIITGAPDWHSVIAVPVIKNDTIKGLLYLSVSVKAKEFGVEEFNFVDTLAKIIAMIL